MQLGSSNNHYDYYMNGKKFQEVTNEKDLGVMIKENLKPELQVETVCAKANRMLGLIKRSVKFRNKKVMVQMYKSLVRPHLEFATSVWSPYYEKDKAKLESVQHRFTRLFPGLKTKAYEERLKELKLWSLEERRNRSDLIEIFKMVKGYSTVPWSIFFARNRNCTRGHDWKLVKKYSRGLTRHHFFSQRVINRWNRLDQEAINSTSVNAFKMNLQRKKWMGCLCTNRQALWLHDSESDSLLLSQEIPCRSQTR